MCIGVHPSTTGPRDRRRHPIGPDTLVGMAAQRFRRIRHRIPRTAALSGVVALSIALTAGAPPGPPAAVAEPAAGAAPAATERPAAEPGPDTLYDWPLDPRPEVTRGFDKPANRYGPGHRGVDLGASTGEPVFSAGPGVVAFAGPVAGRGVVSIDHPSGLRTTYEPLTPLVRAGETVRTGTVIGRVSAGHPGCARAACLHWGLRDGDDYRDPRSLLGTVTVRLLPV